MTATFRLLDAYVGWQPLDVTGLDGFTDPGGVTLARTGAATGGLDRQDLLPWFPDPRLAAAKRAGSWYLLSPAVLRHDACTGTWQPVRLVGDPADLARAPVAIATGGHWLAVVDTDRVLLWSRDGDHLAAVIEVPGARLVAVARDGELVVSRAGSTDLWRYDRDGTPRGRVRSGAPGEVIGLRLDRDHTGWLLTEDTDGLHLSRGRLGHHPFEPATPADLAAALPASNLVATWEAGFCLRERGPDGDPAELCFTWAGAPLADRPRSPRWVTAGELTTEPIDSGLSRCRWHRVSLDADVPAGTMLAIAVTVTEDGEPGAAPDPRDWQRVPAGILDFLVDQPPGRHLRLRLALAGDGTATPVVRRVRLDFPRATSADLLPAAYLQEPAAEDFTERFLSLFDTSLSNVDRAIERHPALLDAAGVPDGVLTWLGGLIGQSFEAGWSPDVRRRLLLAAGDLYRRRGTPAALRTIVEIVTGVEPVLAELAAERNWVTVGGHSRLGTGRLFGRAAARVRLAGAGGVGGSPLGRAPLHGYGDPGGDPLAAHAYRFRLTLPPGSLAPGPAAALTRLVSRQAPAHTAGSVRVGGFGLVVGVRSTVGVDTAFVPLPAPLLGPAPGAGGRTQAARLGRSSVLRPGPRGPRIGAPVGAVVGVQTIAW